MKLRSFLTGKDCSPMTPNDIFSIDFISRKRLIMQSFEMRAKETLLKYEGDQVNDGLLRSLRYDTRFFLDDEMKKELDLEISRAGDDIIFKLHDKTGRK